MTGTSTRGAEWQGGGETKALGHIFGPEAVTDDDEETPPLKVPSTPVHEATQDEIELAAQTQIAAAALKEAEERTAQARPSQLRAGNELLKLQQIFCRLELGRDAIIQRMKEAEGHTWAEISVALPLQLSRSQVRERYYALKKKRPMGLSLAIRGRFLIWAADKFGLKRKTIVGYMSLAREPERSGDNYTKRRGREKAAYKLGRAVLSAQKKPGVPEPLRRAFQALPTPARERWLVWAASLLIGSDDPQSIARWFAKRFAS